MTDGGNKARLKRSQTASESGQTRPVDSSTLDPCKMPDEAGVSSTHTDHVLTKVPPPTDTMAKAERRFKEVMECNTHLERRNTYLTSKVNILEDELSRTRISLDDIMRKLEDEQEECAILESQCKKMNEILKQHEERRKDYEQEVEAHFTLKVTLAELERKYLQVMESNLTLQNEKSELHSLVWDMKNKNSESENNLNIQQTMYVKDLAALKSEKRELEDALTQSSSELQNVHTQAHQLEDECRILVANISRLEEELHRVESSFICVQRTSAELMRDCEHKERMLKNLKAKWKTMNLTVLKNCEEHIQLHSSLRLQHEELQEQYDQLVKDCEDEQLSLAVAMETNALLEKEKSELIFQVKTLRRSMIHLKEELSEFYRRDKEMEQEQQRETSIITNLQLDPESLTDVDRYLIAILAETEKKLMRALRYTEMFEYERADLRSHISDLKNSVQELEQMLFDAESKCNFLQQENHQAVGTLNMLRIQYPHQTLPQYDELVTSFLEDSEPMKDEVMNPT